MMMGEMSQGQREMQSLVRAANATARAQGSMEPVTLVANDGTEIIIDRRAAMVSGTIKSMLAGPAEYSESLQNTIKFPEISPQVLEKVVQYFYYKMRYTNHPGHLPEFKIEPELALELLMAANYLDT